MRKSRAVFLMLIAAVVFMQQSHDGGKTQLRWVSFNDGIAEAKKTGKKVMIDVYTDWCSWCKKMDKNTYAEKSISEYLSSRYVAIRLNAESPTRLQFQERSYTDQELAAAFGVTGYPSTF